MYLAIRLGFETAADAGPIWPAPAIAPGADKRLLMAKPSL
jgi:hypothetical protein